MREFRFSPMAGMMAVAMMGSARSVIEIGDGYEEEKLPPAERRRREAPAPRQLTEADNTRLREAAEKRFRKAQRQAKGIANPPESPRPQSEAKLSASCQTRDEQNPVKSRE